MKQCISRIINIFICLWRTLTKYVCRQQSTNEWIIKVPIQDGEVKLSFQRTNIQPSLDGKFTTIGTSNIEEGGVLSDGKSNSLLESPRIEESQSSQRTGDS